MIQDIYPHTLSNHYDRSAQPGNNDWVMYFKDQDILLKDPGQNKIELPRVSDFGLNHHYTYLFSVDDEMYFKLEDEVTVPAGFDFLSVKKIRRSDMGPQHKAFAVVTAGHLNDWYRDSQFCGRCGNRMEHSIAERAMVCKSCGNVVYPRIMPAVIVGVKNGNKILITKYKEGYGHSALVAGFTEIGETLEETVAREVMEETGVRVKNIRYYKSQPWGTSNDILMGFYCELDGDERIHIDDVELKYGEWVERDKIVLQPDNYSLTNEMMRRFKEGIEE